jgi:hypothetical protein
MRISDLAVKLEERRMLAASLPVVAGFDAFVDEVVQVVGTRHSPESYTALPSIAEFGAWASAAAGRSGSREFVSLDRTAGGCSVNSIDGITTLGFPVDAFVGVGAQADLVFNALRTQCRSLDPVGMEPGRAMVYEFQDGKLMFCSFSHFSEFTPDHLASVLADGGYLKACKSAAGIVLTSWSVYPHMTDCWKFLQREVYSKLDHRPRFFLDLADPASRSGGDLIGMIDALAGFEQVGPTCLSLNGNEANRVAKALGLREAREEPADVERLAGEIRQRAGISDLGIHLIRFATSATAEGAVTVQGPYCATPRRSVGAGDRFNAGCLAGGLLGFSPTERLLLGVAVSGFFVREARSGNFDEIADFLIQWSEGMLD